MATEIAEQMATNVGKTFVWHENYSANPQANIDFYTRALGFGTEEMDMGPGGKYRMLTMNGHAVCGVVDTNDLGMEGIPPHWATYIAVDDVDGRISKCEGLGAKVVVPAMDVPTVGRMALITDPQGAHVWLFTPANK